MGGSCVALVMAIAQAGSFDDFFRAVHVDDVGAVNDLLARGFDPNAIGEKGQPGLVMALRDGADKVAASLLAHPHIVIDTANTADETALMMAALRGRLEWCQRLLDRGAKLDRTGWTPLHYAATGPEPKVVALLIGRGAPIEALSPNRTTPLMMAARYGADESALLLLARGADTKARNDVGLNAADFAKLAGRTKLAERLEASVR